jgi:hypothetical protein
MFDDVPEVGTPAKTLHKAAGTTESTVVLIAAGQQSNQAIYKAWHFVAFASGKVL